MLPDFRRQDNINTSELSVVGAVSEGVSSFPKSLTINSDIYLLFQELGKLEPDSFSHKSNTVWAFLFIGGATMGKAIGLVKELIKDTFDSILLLQNSGELSSLVYLQAEIGLICSKRSASKRFLNM